ncbi:MAG TPA: VOC family protein [Caulobacteraceae bacterium]|nr:VOC family protein [Caulobacteraceae bacterium]
MEQRLSAVTLRVADLDRAARFYAEGLGFEAARRIGDEVVFIQLNGLVLCLYPGLADDAGVADEARGPGLVALAHNVRERGQVDQVLARAAAAGGRVTRHAHDADWGGRSGYFADPDGNLWEIAWNPHWPIDAEGRTRLDA